MKIAIHHRSGSFSDRWIEYCETKNISYRLVNCHANNIIRELGDCCALLWHWQHYVHKDVLVAKQIISAVETMGLKVFPSSSTCESFDNKIAQKYQLESINAPIVPTFIFYELNKALKWIDTAQFPKVFKLSCGAGATNVRLVQTPKEAKRLCNKAFSKGFKFFGGYLADRQVKIKKLRNVKGLWPKVHKVFDSVAKNWKINAELPREKGYVYFQDFLPDNKYDTRVVIIGNRALALQRRNRKNDFRASGGGLLNYDPVVMDKKFIKIAFEISQKLNFQAMGYDFLYDANKNPRINEMSYGFPVGNFLYDCSGYWDEKIIWHEGHIHPEDAILMDLIKSACSKEKQLFSHST